MCKTIILKPNYNIRPVKNIQDINPRLVVKELLNQGYEDLILMGIPLDKCIDGVHLWIEPDVDFLIESCQYLEEIILKDREFEHYSFLNDGLLQIEAKINNKIVQVIYKYYPGLNKNNLNQTTTQIPLERYLWWWRNICYDLLTFIDS